jgi:hypothetical protein
MLTLEVSEALKSNPIRAKALKLLKVVEPDTLISKEDYGFLVIYLDGSEEWFF